MTQDPHQKSENTSRGLDRRNFFRLTGAGAAAGIAVTPQAGAFSPTDLSSDLQEFGSSSPEPVQIPVGELPFRHSVASGDPLPDRVILWTRVTPSEEAFPGSGVGEDVRIAWEIASDDAFAAIVGSGEAIASAAHDHTVHVDASGLNPSSTYFFRFRVIDGPHAGAISPVGRTRTAPDFGASVDQLNIGFGSCANWESGYFAAYRDAARRGQSGELDLMVFLGDYIYEYARYEYSGFGPFRLFDPPHDIVTLADYRMRYGQYRTDPDLQAAHAALPWVVVWDDHETANNSWREGAENHDPASQGDWFARRNAAMQAYFEWLPIRATSPSKQGHIYRSFTYGDLMELTMMDLRTYRDEEGRFMQLSVFNDPSRTMLGSEQAQWLQGKLTTSTAKWNVLGNSVMFSPMNVITLQQDPRTADVSSFLAEHNIDGVPVNSDQWDGYGAAQDSLLELLASLDSNVLMLTGDIHSEWAHEIRYQGRIIGAEIVGTSVSAPNVDEILKLPINNPISQLAEQYLLAANPHLHHVELDQHGYTIARITPDSVVAEYYRTPDVTNPTAEVSLAKSMTFVAGAGFR